MDNRMNLPNEHYSQINALRFFAAFGVIHLHWFDKGILSLFDLTTSLDFSFGSYGVQIFFILSGFLIAEILIKKKRSTEDRSRILKNFYIRRVLRIFPVYFLYIFLLLLLKDKYVLDNIIWYLSHTVNIRFYLDQSLSDIWSDHLWTLSIEEQFYLFFPLIFVFISKRMELVFVILLLSFSIVYDVVSVNNEFHGLLLPGQSMFLGAGIFLAVLKQNYFTIFGWFEKDFWKYLSLVLLITTIVVYYIYFPVETNNVFIDIYLAIIFSLLVVSFIYGFNSGLKKLFENSFIGYLGQISYGLYIFHKIIPLVVLIFTEHFNIHLNLPLFYFVNLSLLILLSHFSWRFFESKFLLLKKYF